MLEQDTIYRKVTASRPTACDPRDKHARAIPGKPTICLVNPPISHSYNECHPPINLLSLATTLRMKGFSAKLLDLHLMVCEGTLPINHLYEMAPEIIADTAASFLGFTSICTSYLTTVLLAKHCKLVDQNVTIILGGPYASAIDAATLTLFPWVDFVVRGEGEDTLPHLLRALFNNEPLSDVAGISYRLPSGKTMRTPRRAARRDLSSLGMPAYDLIENFQPYRNALAVEGGRGCPFSCTYCGISSACNPNRQLNRVLSPRQVVDQMQHLASVSGSTSFWVLYSDFCSKKRFLSQFCQEATTRPVRLEWRCNARTNSATRGDLETMAKASCVGIFFGAESGSDNILQLIKKRTKASDTLPAVKATLDAGIHPTVSFMIGFHEETPQELNATLELALCCRNLGNVSVHLHLTTLLPQTEMWQEHKDKLQLTAFSISNGDMGIGRNATIEEAAAIRAYPDVFSSFYSITPKHLSLDLLYAIRVGFPFVVDFHAKSFLYIMQLKAISALDLYQKLYSLAAGCFDFQDPRVVCNLDNWPKLLFSETPAEIRHNEQWDLIQSKPLQALENIYKEWALSYTSESETILPELLQYESDQMQVRDHFRATPSQCDETKPVPADAYVRLSEKTYLFQYKYDVTDTVNADLRFTNPERGDTLIMANTRSGAIAKCPSLVLAILAQAGDGVTVETLCRRTARFFDGPQKTLIAEVNRAVAVLVKHGYLSVSGEHRKSGR